MGFSYIAWSTILFICHEIEKCSQVPATVTLIYSETLIYSILLVSSSMIAKCNYLSQPHAMDPVMRNM